MSITNATRVVPSPSAPSPEFGALLGTVSSPELATLLAEAFALGVRAARLRPVCDWCGEPVVLANLGWCHQATARYGCEPEPLWSCVAQVNGSLIPAPAAEPCSDPEPLPIHPAATPVRRCDTCECQLTAAGYHASPFAVTCPAQVTR